MDSEIITLSEVIQTEKDIPHDTACIWTLLKNDVNELIYKTEIDPQT